MNGGHFDPIKNRFPKWYTAGLYITNSAANMPTKRDFLPSSVIDDKIYVIGGHDRSESGYNDVHKLENECYNTLTNTWESKAPLPTNRCYAPASVVDKKIYVMGGSDSNYSPVNFNECYDPVTDTWNTKANMLTGRKGGVSCVVDNKIYVLCGDVKVGKYLEPTNINECYDPITNTWTTKTQVPTSKTNFTACQLSGKIYIFGGFSNSGGVLNTNECYDPITDTWVTKASMPEPVHSLCCTTMNGIAYVFGGNNAFNPLPTTRTYNPITEQWTQLTNTPRNIRNGTVSAIGGCMYIIGGYMYVDQYNAGATNKVDIFLP